MWVFDRGLTGVRGGSEGAILRRFDTRKDNTAFDKDTHEAFSKTRWLELKRVHKLCDDDLSKKKGDDGHNPAHTCDLICDCIVENTAAVSKRACLDQCADETSFPFQGHGEKGIGLVCQRGLRSCFVRTSIGHAQEDMFTDTSCMRRSSHVPAQMKCAICGKSLSLWLSLQPNQPKALFSETPHVTWDDCFSGDSLFQSAADEGLGLTMTCRRDRPPKGAPGEHWQKDKTSTAHRTEVACLQQPIFAIKKHNNSIIQVASFQSTSSHDIVCVNALNASTLFSQAKEHRGKCERHWGIEMNEARQLCPWTCGAVDQLDHLIAIR